jgi:multiple sugar transport system permease protein
MARQTAAERALPRGRGSARLSQRAQEELWAYLFLSPWIIGFLIFTLGAMVFSLILSFFNTDLLETWKFIGLQNYTNLANDSLFWNALRVTFVYTILAVPFGTAIALVIAVLLNQKIRPLGFWRTVYYLPALVSGVAVAVLWGWVLDPDYGLLNTALHWVGIPGPRWLLSEFWVLPGIVLIALWGAGANMLLYLAGLQSIPTQLEEAARIDGANRWHLFRHITLPLLTPTLLFLLIVETIRSFQSFDFFYQMMAALPVPGAKVVTIYLYEQGFKSFNLGYAAAIGMLLFAIIFVLTLLQFRATRSRVVYAD